MCLIFFDQHYQLLREVAYACLILHLPLFSYALQVVLVGPPGHGKAALYGLLLVNLGVVARHTIERIVQTYGVRSASTCS